MLRATLTLLALALAGTAGAEAGYRHEEAEDGTILIVVAPEDLLECQVTLAMVLHPMVAAEDEAAPLTVAAPAAPEKAPAVCVAEGR